MPHSIQVPSEIVRKWQEIVDLLAAIVHVPSVLIMRVEAPYIKVFVSSESEGNPYEPDELAPLNTGLYCETVMKTRQPLLVPDALGDEAWKSNPDIKLGMISYLGVPVSWPDGEIFGTICILDSKRNEYSELYLKLLMQWREVLQSDLRWLTTLHRGLEEREAKIRRLVEANIIGIVIWNLQGQVLDANDAFLRMVGYDREDLVSGRARWTDMTPAEWRDRDALAVDELKRTGIAQPFEKEYLRKDGSRVPVLIGAATFEGGGNEGVAFVLDLTERKRAEAEARESERRYREMQMQLAHANRVAAMGQLTASIGHEMKQPITATIINAQAALRFLDGRSPDLEEVRETLACIIKDGHRAGNVIGGIRDHIKKAPPREDRLDINEAIREVIELTHSEAVKNGVSVRPDLAEGLHQRLRGNERRRGHARIADQHRESRERGRAGRGARFGSGLGPSDARARLRVLLHDQAERFGAGAVDLPVDHRSARRKIVGERERAARRPFSAHGACRPGYGSMILNPNDQLMPCPPAKEPVKKITRR